MTIQGGIWVGWELQPRKPAGIHYYLAYWFPLLQSESLQLIVVSTCKYDESHMWGPDKECLRVVKCWGIARGQSVPRALQNLSRAAGWHSNHRQVYPMAETPKPRMSRELCCIFIGLLPHQPRGLFKSPINMDQSFLWMRAISINDDLNALINMGVPVFLPTISKNEGHHHISEAAHLQIWVGTCLRLAWGSPFH